MTQDLVGSPEKEPSQDISAKEVCDIIRLCKKSGVISFKFGELVLEFGDKLKSDKPRSSKNDDQDESEDSTSNPDLDQLMIEDPIAYEHYLQSLETEDA